MLPYQEDGQKLENLLQSLFEGEFTSEDGISILRIPFSPEIYSSCCTYSYASYDGK
jgi:hypothetical protein